jgi:hypothetical protein
VLPIILLYQNGMARPDRAYPEMVYSRWVRFLAELSAMNAAAFASKLFSLTYFR